MPAARAITLSVAAASVFCCAGFRLQDANSAVHGSPTASDEAKPILRRAGALFAEHHDDAAAKLLNAELAKRPENVEALALLAHVREDQAQTDDAFALLTKALSISPNSPLANVAMGELLFSQHRYPEAMDRFETVLAIDLRNEEARKGELQAVTALATLARQDQHPERALFALEHAREKLPDDPQLLLEVGMQANDLGKIPEALDVLQAARMLAPKDGDVVYALARVEMVQQNMPAAERDLRAYLALQPNDASAHYGLGRVLELQQRTKEARAEFARSVTLQPVQTESYYELGQMDLDANQDATAEESFGKVLRRDPKHGGALTGMGILSFRKKRYAEAEDFLAKAEATAPEYQPAHYYRGLALARLGKKAEADEELATAIKLDHQQQAPPAAKDADGPAMAAPLR